MDKEKMFKREVKRIERKRKSSSTFDVSGFETANDFLARMNEEASRGKQPLIMGFIL